MSFVKINTGDKVFDKQQSIKGTVTSIDTSSNVAEIVADNIEDEVVLCRLSDLIIVHEKREEGSSEPSLDYNKWYHQVKEFHEAFNHPVADEPTPLTLERIVARQTWTVEELIEGLQASSGNEEEFLQAYDKLLEGMGKAKQKSLKEDYPKNDIEKLVAQADALTDALYFVMGSFVEINLTPNELFDIVQRSNMSKLFTSEDGEKYAKYRESDGKILKSPEFFPPEPSLEKEIQRQLDK